MCDEKAAGKKDKCVAYISNDDLIKVSDKFPKIPGRASVVHSLIQAYGLLEQMRLINPRPAREDELLLFHTKEYIDCLKKLSSRDDEEKYDEEAEQYGLTYDCPVYPGAFDNANYVAGSTVKAAQCLMMGLTDIAINWTGGWHHSKRDAAAGFCYLNDIVIAILKLRQKFDRVMYIDLDLHHGDGVEEAFSVTPKVMTVSFHKYSPGFYPGTGKLCDVGIGKGKNYCVNVPLKDGVQNSQFTNVFDRVMHQAKECFQPLAVVCQCGADALVGDPMDSFNLTSEAYVHCVKYVANWGLPLLLVGGGGYNIASTARCWTSITASILGQSLSDDIPEHKYFPLYGPDYELALTPGNRPNTNPDEDIELVTSQVIENLQKIKVVS